MARHAAVVAMAALAVLAGCGGFGGGGTPDDVTPAPVPTTEPPVVDGVTRDAVNASRVVAGHERALANVSYTSHSSLRAREPDGDTAVRFEISTRRGPDGRFLYERAEPSQEVPGRSNATEIWFDGNRSFFRNSYGSGPVTVFTINQRAAIDIERTETLNSVFSDVTVTRVTRLPSGGAEVVGRFTNGTAAPTAGVLFDPSNGSMRTRIGPDGLVRALAVSYDATYEGNRTAVRYTLSFDDVGATTVERPSWVTG